MNRLFIAAALFSTALFTACESQPAAEGETTEITTENVEKTTSIAFAEEAFDFGAITEGEKVEHTFKFTNSGSEDLVIVSAKGSCGCTVPDYPKEPIKPGAEGEIHVVFNSEGKSGKQHKQVSIVANTEPSTTVIAITGEVVSPDGKTEPAQTSSEG